MGRLWHGISISGNTAVVGAGNSDVGDVPQQGAAYVFYRDQGGLDAWGQGARLTAGDGAARDYFGSSVSTSGDSAVVGAWGADVGGADDRGAAYVFSRNQGSPDAWGLIAKLTAADGVAGDRFGYSVSQGGDMPVVGAMRADVGSNEDQGAAYVYALPSLHPAVYLPLVVRNLSTR